MRERVTVAGAGTIGISWTVVFTRAGLVTQVFEPDDRLRETLPQRFAELVAELVEGGTVTTSDADRMASLLRVCPDLATALDGAEYVQESIAEELDLKRALYTELERLSPAQTVIGSSTSALPMTQIARHLAHPQRCCVVHPTNPPHIIPLVEIVPGERTAPGVVADLRAFMERLGMTPIVCELEIYGFVLNRLQAALEREAFSLHRAGVASVADIDRTVRDGLALRWAFLGPFLVEHTASASITDTFAKFETVIAQLFADIDRPFPPPTSEEVAGWEQEINEMLAGASHADVVRYRNAMILELRRLKRGREAAPSADDRRN